MLPPRIARPRAADLQSIIRSLWADSLDITSIGAEFADISSELGMPPGYDALSAIRRYAPLSASVVESSRILAILIMGAQRNTMRAFSGSLRPAASGVRNYKNFFDFIGRPPFPAQTDTVL